jgi:hypothetical protein
MQKVLIGLIGLLVVAGIGLFIWMKTAGSETPDTGTQTTPNNSGGSFNNSTSVVPTPADNTPGATQGFTVATQTGAVIAVKDFKADPLTVEDKNNKGHYYLAGGLDPTSIDAPYGISYVESDQSFQIGLYKEPLRDYRKFAEQEFISKLGISEPEACALRYWVSVPTWVSATYSTKNLGFSFCPGAVELP